MNHPHCDTFVAHGQHKSHGMGAVLKLIGSCADTFSTQAVMVARQSGCLPRSQLVQLWSVGLPHCFMWLRYWLRE